MSVSIKVNYPAEVIYPNIPWSQGMSVLQAMELAYTQNFKFAVQYYGQEYGYFVLMINGTYNNSLPSNYWFLYVNGECSHHGVSETVLNDNDQVEFRFQQYKKEEHAHTPYKFVHEYHQQEQ